ncbi:MAG: FMN-binding protein [Candidatus Neomarinimicrobiota bacterium]
MKRIIFLTVICLSALSLLNSCKQMDEYHRRVDAIEIENIDLQKVKDGDYSGEYNAILVNVAVLVKVRDHRITEIELVRHNNGRGKPAEVITSSVIEKQSLAVDTITGATSSSKVILEAIELALKKGLE